MYKRQVHSMVEFKDGAVMAQMGCPDMRLAIMYAFTYPGREATGVKRLDFTSRLNLSFSPPDPGRFPCLRLAYEALRMGGTAPAVLNGANEEAVSYTHLKPHICPRHTPANTLLCLNSSRA